ncbi:BgTH12-07341 [Blumeria graminis f. sp. triticale]|uniref:BgTH12-07341 n=1 Tax=Blumeria graminis f. sp. triticale TaxID=1689686 RepID=A0A9W4DEN3_BLUGR|nr:BgTH12-07341 [Blumeria graminis f. sp. triticale]
MQRVVIDLCSSPLPELQVSAHPSRLGSTAQLAESNIDEPQLNGTKRRQHHAPDKVYILSSPTGDLDTAKQTPKNVAGDNGTLRKANLDWLTLSPNSHTSPCCTPSSAPFSDKKDPFSTASNKKRPGALLHLSSPKRQEARKARREPLTPIKAACKSTDPCPEIIGTNHSTIILSPSPPTSREISGAENLVGRKITVKPSGYDKDKVWHDDFGCELSDQEGKVKSPPVVVLSVKPRRKASHPITALHDISNTCSASTQNKPDPRESKKNIKTVSRKAGIAKTEREIFRQRERAQKEEAREAGRQKRLKEKEERMIEKERIAAISRVNKLKDRLETTTEMIVELPNTMSIPLAKQVCSFLDGVQAEHTMSSSDLNIIRWRRKVKARWDPSASQWLPIPECVQEENHIMYHITAKEMVDLITGSEGHDFYAHMLQLKARFADRAIIILIEGLKTWRNQNRAVKNKKFVSAVRNHLVDPEQLQLPSKPSMSHRPKKAQVEYVAESLVDEALLELQVVHAVLVHHTDSLLETAEWVMTFTQHISTIPYKIHTISANNTNFCIDRGQINCGKDTKDTYIQMLQQMRMVTQPVAMGIEAMYPSVQKLFRGLEESGPLALEQCRKSAHRNGSLTDVAIGQAVSRRIHRVFLGKDPASWEI